MGRRSKGSWHTQEAARIELSFLLRKGYFKKEKLIKGVLKWDWNGKPAGNITIISSNFENEIWLRLMYTVSDYSTGEKQEYDYKIYLEAVPSNLGKGDVLYFVCPQSGRRCRVLYRAYGLLTWKSREAFQNRLYYPGQICSKYERDNERFCRTEEALRKLGKIRRTSTYKGKPTKWAISKELLEHRYYYLDLMRFNPKNMPKRLWAMFGRL